MKTSLKALGFAVLTALALASVPANASPTTYAYVKSTLEQRFALQPSEVGMKTTSIPSSDCAIRIVDGRDAGAQANADQAALQVMKDGQVLNFILSERMSYDIVLGSIIDLTATKKSGVNTHSVLLKISATKLRLTRLNLYPSENETESDRTKSITCQL